MISVSAAHRGSCLQETLTRHKPMVAEYLDENYDRVSLSLPVPFALFFEYS